MNISDPYLNLIGVLGMFTLGLLAMSWVPWCLAAAVHARQGSATRAKRTIRQATGATSLVIWLALLLRPQAAATGPPGFSWVDPVLADPGLANISPLGLLMVRAVLLAECVLALVMPVLLVVLRLAVKFYLVALAPSVALAAPWALHLATAGRRRQEKRRAAEAKRERRLAVARMQAEQRRTEEAQKAAENDKKAARKERRLAARRQAVGRLSESLDELPNLPDARRATLVATKAETLRPKHRRELFQLYRGEIIRHGMARLKRGENHAKVLESVAELLAALSVPGPDHEAAYILDEAAKQLPSPNETFREDYGKQLAQLLEQHRIRVQAVGDLHLDELAQDDDELTERLLERERELLKEKLLNLNPAQEDATVPPLEVPFAPFPQPEVSAEPRHDEDD